MINALGSAIQNVASAVTSAPVQVAQQVAAQVGLPAVQQTLTRLQNAAPPQDLRSPVSAPQPFSLPAAAFQSMGQVLSGAQPQLQSATQQMQELKNAPPGEKKSWKEIAQLERDLNKALKEENDPKANEILQSMSKADMSMMMVMQFLRDQRMQELQRVMSHREEF